jgi:toxin CptA
LRPSSETSSSFRIDWRTSRWLVAGLVSLGALAAVALMLAELPPPLAAVMALGSVLRGLQLARQEWRRAACTLVCSGALPSWRLAEADGRQVPLHQVRWHLRGPLAVMRGREAGGRRCQFVWAPDTLCTSQRRQLRLAGVVSSRSEKPLPAVAA